MQDREPQKMSLEVQIEDVAEKAGGLLRSRYGLWSLGAVSFVESALPVPLITDPFLVAYILANRGAAWRGVMVTLITSLLGGLFAYALAFWFYELIAAHYLSGPLGEQFYTIVDDFKSGTFIMAVVGAITPIPYTLVALAAGFIKGNVVSFIMGTLVGRLIRYGIVGWLAYQYGDRALEIARKQTFLVTLLTVVAVLIYILFIH